MRKAGIEAPRVHDVSQILRENSARMTQLVSAETLEKLCEISHQLRRDRELAFYGSEDLTPSEFYTHQDAQEAKAWANWALGEVEKSIG